MKKLILSVLMVVMLAVPCMAEVEPEGFFSWSSPHIEIGDYGASGIVIPFLNVGLSFGRNDEGLFSGFLNQGMSSITITY